MKTAGRVLALLLVAGAARADVTIKSKIESGGFKGMGAFGGTVERAVKGDRAREESDVDYKGGFMRAVTTARGGVEIIRVDLDKIWVLQPKKKTYTERSVSLPPEEENHQASDPSYKKPPPADKKEEAPTHRLKKSEFTVRQTGQKKTVNGFVTDESEILLTAEVEEIATKEVTVYKLLTSVWATPWTADLRKATADESAFGQAYAKKLGVHLSPDERRLFDPHVVAMMLGVPPAKAEETLGEAKKKMETINGFPIVVDARWTVQEDPKAVARRKAEAPKETEESGIELSGGVSGAATSIMGGFAKRKMKASQEKKAVAREGLPMFSSYREVLSVTVDPVPPDRFEVPKDYKKISAR